jgi:phosphinothricin acetyltransferase
MILKATLEHANAIASIYNYYIHHTTHTFELESVSDEEIYQRISSPKTISWIVFLDSDKVVGYAYASCWKDRAAYMYTAEVSIYLEPNHLRKKVGNALYSVLFEDLKGRGYRSIIAGIALPNPASISFHENFGFRKVAHFEHVGYKFEAWIDVAYWQLML